MRIVDVRERTVPIRSSIRNAWIDFSQMTCSVVSVVTDVVRGSQPVVGYGFNSNGRYAQGGLLRERFIPRLLAASPDALIDPDTGALDPLRVGVELMRNEKPGGHGERSVAVGALDMAMWDIAAKVADVPLAVLLAARRGAEPAVSIQVYAAGGYYDRDKGIEGLRSELAGYIDAGYTAVKLKVGGSTLDDDRRRIDAAIAVAGGPAQVAIDANGRLDIATALVYAGAIADLGLKWYEEPVDPLDYDGHARLAEEYPGPLATGENLFSLPDVRNLLRYAGLRKDTDILQMDPVLSYGLSEYLRMLELIESDGWPLSACVPHGGHLLNLHAAAGLGLMAIEAYPAVFRPFGGFGDANPVEGGSVRVPDAPGLGFELDTELFAVLESAS
jgi:L-alanine-DL-glutamate epimerase-like enolase superfamily enzyme